MAKKQERPNKVLDSIVRTSTARARRQISDWQAAIRGAENPIAPKRVRLYDIYNDVMLDAHLISELNKRKNSLLQSDFNLYDESGKPNHEATAEIKKAWFYKLLSYAFDARAWGHSLIEITQLTEEGKIKNVELVNRWHVIPEFGIVVPNKGDEAGIPYRDNPKFSGWLFEVGDKEDLGLLLKAVPHVLYKRFAQGAWSEFTELYGIPPRYVKTPSRDEGHLRRLELMLRDMGASSYGVFNDDEEFHFMDVPTSDGSIFQNLMKVSANEISKLINGSVIGEDSESGSRAKEQVGMELTQNIWNGDKTWLEGEINENWLPMLVDLGYPFDGLRFEFNREKNLQEEWKIVDGVLRHFTVDPEYIIETFGIPVIEQKMNPTNPPAEAGTKALGNSFFD